MLFPCSPEKTHIFTVRPEGREAPSRRVLLSFLAQTITVRVKGPHNLTVRPEEAAKQPSRRVFYYF